MPFGYNNEYENWEDCIAKNRDKRTPDKYCGYIKHQTEDIIPPECIVKTINHYKTKYPEWSMNDVLKKSFNYLKNRNGNDFVKNLTNDYLYNFNPAELRMILEGLYSLYVEEGSEDKYIAETIRNIVDQINSSSTGLFSENEELAILINNMIKEEHGESTRGSGRGWWRDAERHSRARKTGHADTLDFILLEIAQEYDRQVHDFLTYDAEATRLQEQFELLKKLEESARTPEARALRAQLGGTFKPPVQSIETAFMLRNSETGAIVRGSVKRNLADEKTQLTPVSSSNVRGVGAFKDELLVQFHGDGRTARRTYRYKMASPEMAEEAYNSLTGSGSPGRWVWENIRGHRAGEPVTKNKLAPSLSPPGKGRKTIGGTTASLLEYSISNRVPVSRVAGFEAMSKQLKRQTSNPTLNPNTNSRVEGYLEGRRASRDKGRKQLEVSRQLRQLPKLDFTVKVLDANDLITDSFEELLAWVKEKKKPKDDEEAEKIAWAIINNAQTKATKKGKQPYKKKEYYDISALKKKLPSGERWRLEYIEDAVKTFPKKAFKKASPDILIVSTVTDHEDWKQYKGKVPKYFQKVGINRTYEDIKGIYHPVYNQCVISLKNALNGFDITKTVYHEIAHSVWEYGDIPLDLRQKLIQDVETYQEDIKEKYYHEPTEMFALLFEVEGHELLFKEKAKIEKENVVKNFIDIYNKIREEID